jgi:hypothetical protein
MSVKRKVRVSVVSEPRSAGSVGRCAHKHVGGQGRTHRLTQGNVDRLAGGKDWIRVRPKCAPRAIESDSVMLEP